MYMISPVDERMLIIIKPVMYFYMDDVDIDIVMFFPVSFFLLK